MKYIKMFIAGLALPSVLLPCLLFIAWDLGRDQVFTIPYPHFIPIFWGIWNVFYITCLSEIFPKNPTIKPLLSGAILGILLAAYAVFGLNIPAIIGLPISLTYLPLIAVPILYAILWLYIVDPLNHMLGVTKRNK